MPERLVLAGSGGFGRETAELVRAINAAHAAERGTARWDLLGFLDDDEARWGTTVSGLPVLGGIDSIADHPDASVAVCTGNPRDFSSRRRIVGRLGLAPIAIRRSYTPARWYRRPARWARVRSFWPAWCSRPTSEWGPTWA